MDITARLKRNYEGKTVLVTGHTGFKGGWLSLWLESLGANVVGYSIAPPTSPSFFKATDLKERVISIEGDICDYNKVLSTLDDHKPDYIFHLAAQPLVKESYIHPRNTFAVNVMGTVNLLDALRTTESMAICICVTSDKCYENKEWDYAYRENDEMGGHDPYSASKGASEIVISSYRRSFFNNYNTIASVRAGNVIGGGDWATDRIVPDCIRALSHNEKIKVRNPLAVRPWQFVLEPLFGYLLLASKMNNSLNDYSGAWNFGPNYNSFINVKTLVEKIIGVWGSGKVKFATSNDSVHETKFLKLDITKAVTRLGWKPIYNIDEAVEKTIEWYNDFYFMPANAYKASLVQIENYMNDANILL